MANEVLLTPLGGVGEFGMNMMLVQSGDDLVVLDAGMMFPEPNMLGVDFVLPDTTYLLQRRGHVRGILLTHGHEDHIGGLAHLLQDVAAPVYGTKLTLALATPRLNEHRVASGARLCEIDENAQLDFGSLRCEFIQVAHSIPGTLAVVLRTPAGTILHTSDFKLDHTPVGKERLDVARLAQLGNEGVQLLLSDSTNVEQPGYTASERSILPRLEAIFRSARGRIVVSTFSSNLYRIQQFIDLAARFRRFVAVTGRSMVQNVGIASDLGHLSIPAGMVVDVRDVDDIPSHEVMVLTTGSQGEPLSALSLMASGSHARLRVEPGDTVIISARIIPGHEREVGGVVNQLYRRGAEVFYGPEPGIHVSGHGSQEDLKMMLQLVRPRHFVPVHGEYRHLMLHARLAEQLGMPASNVLVAEDGVQIRLTRDGCSLGDKVPAGRVLVDGRLLEELEDVVLRDRHQLAQDGMVIVILLMERQTGQVVADPDIVSRGFVHVDASEELLDEAGTVALDAVAGLNDEERCQTEVVQEAVRHALRRFFTKRTDRRPLVLPVVIEV
jgi:ribonuclease J